MSLHRFSPNSCLPSQANPSPISHRWSSKKRFHLSKDPGTAPRFLLRNWRMPTKVTKILWGWLSVMKFFFKEKTQQTVVTFFKMIVRYISKQLKRLPSLFVNACQAYFLRKKSRKIAGWKIHFDPVGRYIAPVIAHLQTAAFCGCIFQHFGHEESGLNTTPK